MDRWKIVIVTGDPLITNFIGYIYMDWNNLPFAHFYNQALRMVGQYTLYLAVREKQCTDGA